MGTESIEASFLSVFALISFFVFLLANKFSHKIREGVLLDKDFSKPQAFHKSATSRAGGLAGIISLNIFFIIYYLIYSKILFEYIFICNLMFIVGFLDDLKVNVSPFKRLLIMIFFLFFIIHIFPIKILSIDIPFLSILVSNSIFPLCLSLLCFLFIVNGKFD